MVYAFDAQIAEAVVYGSGQVLTARLNAKEPILVQVLLWRSSFYFCVVNIHCMFEEQNWPLAKFTHFLCQFGHLIIVSFGIGEHQLHFYTKSQCL